MWMEIGKYFVQMECLVASKQIRPLLLSIADWKNIGKNILTKTVKIWLLLLLNDSKLNPTSRKERH